LPFGAGGVDSEILTFQDDNSNPVLRETVRVGQFRWGSGPLKSNGGVQRSANFGWKSKWSHKRKSWLDCKGDIPRRCESRV